MSSLSRIYRLIELLGVLQAGRGHNAAQLADLCRVSRRTIYRDLHALRTAGVPVQFDPERLAYSIAGSFFLPPTNLTLEEALALIVLCYELGSEHGVPFQRPARAAALKLGSTLSGSVRDAIRPAAEAVRVRLEQINPLSGKAPVYEQLMQAVARRQDVRIEYESFFENELIQTRLSAYRLLFARRSWYVIGRSSLHRAVRTFNVGRIRHIEMLASRYTIPPRFSLDRYLGNAWHLIPEPGGRQDVHARFQPLVARNVAEVRWHKTQRLNFNDDGTLDFRVCVDGLNEIMWWLLGYGDQVEVLAPAELRAMMRRRIDGMVQLYRSEATTRSRAPRRRRRKPPPTG